MCSIIPPLDHNTARSNHCCNYRNNPDGAGIMWSQYRSQLSLLQQQALKALAQSGFPSPFWQTKWIFAELFIKIAHFCIHFVFQPLKLSCSKAFTIWQTPIVLFLLTSSKSEHYLLLTKPARRHITSTLSKHVRWTLRFRDLPITCILYPLLLYLANKKRSCNPGLVSQSTAADNQ